MRLKRGGAISSSITIASCLLVMALPQAVRAQEGEGHAGSAGEDIIVVTAQFREQNLQQTPIAITAVSGEMLQARSQTNVQQVAAQAPSVSLQQGNAAFGPSMVATIRGVGQNDYSPAVEPGVGMYIDDVYYATLTGSMFDLLDLDRIEVLRGPQGTLAGRNSIGGAIKLYSKKPEGNGEGMVQATYGSRDRVDLRGSFDFALAPTLSARIAAVSKTQKGYVDNYDFGCVNPPGSALNPSVGGIAARNPVGSDCLVERHGNVNYQAVRGQLRFQPSADIDINIAADYTHDDRAPAAGVVTYADQPSLAARGTAQAVPVDSRFICGPFCNYANGYMPLDAAHGANYDTSRKSFTRYNGWGVSAVADFHLSDELQLTSITGYRKYNTKFASDDDGTPQPVSGTYNDLDFEFFSQELRLNGSVADDLVLYTIGGYYGWQETVYANIIDIRNGASAFQFASLGDKVPVTSKAVFANVSIQPTEQLTLNGGIRYTDEKKDYTFSRVFPDGTPGQPIVGPLNDIVGQFRGKRVDYRANIQYQVTPDLMTYATFSTGFKGGGINPRPYFPSQAVAFDPEELKAYEIGIKSDLFDRRARINIAAFFNDYKNIQLTLNSCPQYNPPGVPIEVTTLPCSATANAGSAHLKGVELETTLRPVDGLLIDGSLSYLDFEYQSINEAASLGASGVQLTDVAPYQSKWKWSLGMQYEVQMGNGGTITPRVDLSYQSSFYVRAHNTATGLVDGRTLANARITWRNEGRDLEISGEVTNIFDKYYITNIFDGAASQGYAVSQPGRPREWALAVTKRF